MYVAGVGTDPRDGRQVSISFSTEFGLLPSVFGVILNGEVRIADSF